MISNTEITIFCVVVHRIQAFADNQVHSWYKFVVRYSFSTIPWNTKLGTFFQKVYRVLCETHFSEQVDFTLTSTMHSQGTLRKLIV